MYKLVDVPIIPDSAIGAFKLFKKGQIAEGDVVRAFESKLEEILDSDKVLAVNTDSAGIYLSLSSLGVGRGDKVVLSPMVCLAVSIPVLQTGASVKWCDVEPLSGMLDIDKLYTIDLSDVKALIISSWCGNTTDLEEIYKLCSKNDVSVIVDAMEAFGSHYDGCPINNKFSDFVVYSFGPVKHVTSVEGGVVLCRSEKHFEIIKRLKRYGLDRENFRDQDGELDPSSDVDLIGGGYSFNNIFAYIGLTQLEKFDELRQGYLDAKSRLLNVLDKYSFIHPSLTSPRSESCPWVLSTVTNCQLPLLRFLKANGVMASKVHLKNYVYSCFGESNFDTPLEGVEKFQDMVLCLPCRPNLNEDYYFELDKLLKEFQEKNDES